MKLDCRRPRGRPRPISEEERRRRLVEAAQSVFLASDFSDANMEDVAKQAGMSKKTLYQVFPTRTALFAAMIGERSATLFTDAAEDGVRRTPREFLIMILERIAEFLLSPGHIALFRLLCAETLRSPELGRTFLQDGPDRAKAVFAAWLEEQHAKGYLNIGDPFETAEMLFQMALGYHHMRAVIGGMPPPPAEEIRAHIIHAVDLFLKGAFPRPPIPVAR